MAPTSFVVTVDCELLELTVAALPCIWLSVALAPLYHSNSWQLCSPHFPFFFTPPLELLALLLFALSFALAFLFPFLFALVLVLVLTFVLDPANLHGFWVLCGSARFSGSCPHLGQA